MFAGAYYIWIMLAFFLGVVVLIAILAIAFFIGHRLEKRQTGATHGFLELPTELREKKPDDDSPK